MTTTLDSAPDDTTDEEPEPKCDVCGHDDPDELQRTDTGDLHCGDCRSTFADLDDAAEYRAYAYH